MSADPPPIPSLRQRKKADLRRAILVAARASFLQKGYEASRVEDLAAAVGVSVPTLYNYFPSKDAVLQALIRENLRLWARELLLQTTGRGSVRAQLRAFYRRMAREMQADVDLWRAVARTDALNFARWPEQRQAEAAEHDYLERILDSGRNRGEITVRFRPRRLAVYLTSMQDHICWEWATRDTATEPVSGLEKELLRGVDFFLGGASARQ